MLLGKWDGVRWNGVGTRMVAATGVRWNGGFNNMHSIGFGYHNILFYQNLAKASKLGLRRFTLLYPIRINKILQRN